MNPTATASDLVHLRWYVPADLEDVLAIERASFLDPWNERDFETVNRERRVVGYVIESAAGILGFAFIKFGTRSLEILDLAVKPEARRRGVGGGLMIRARADCLHYHARRTLTMLVREGNLRGQLFLKANGFQAVEVLPDFYETVYPRGGDAYRFVWSSEVPA